MKNILDILRSDKGGLSLGGASTNSIRDTVNNLTINQPTEPGGDDKDVQFNDDGDFGGESDFEYDKSDNSLDLEGHMAIGADASPDQTYGISNFPLGGHYKIQVLNLRETVTDVSIGSVTGILSFMEANLDSDDTGFDLAGAAFLAKVSSGSSKDLRRIVGMVSHGFHDGTGTVTDLYGAQILGEVDAGATVTNAHALFVQVDWDGTVSRKYGIKLRDLNGNDATGGDNYGLFITGMVASDSTAAPSERGINIASLTAHGTGSDYTASLNIFRGPILLGSLADTNIPAPATLFIRNDNFAHEITGSGTISDSGTTITGSSSAFLTEARAGSTIVGSILEVDTSPKQYRMITAVAGDTSLTVDSAFGTTFSGATYKIKHPTALVLSADKDNDGGPGLTIPFIVNAVGDVGIKTRFPSEALEVVGNLKVSGQILFGSSVQGLTDKNVVVYKGAVVTYDGNVVFYEE